MRQGSLVAALPANGPHHLPLALWQVAFGEEVVRKVGIVGGRPVHCPQIMRPAQVVVAGQVGPVPDGVIDIRIEVFCFLGVLEGKDNREAVGGCVAFVAWEYQVHLEHAVRGSANDGPRKGAGSEQPGRKEAHGEGQQELSGG